MILNKKSTLLKIPIDITRLTDSPYTKETKNSFILEDDEYVDQIIQELNNAHPTSYLISGYRGAGKTSFINRILERIDENSITVCISLSKYEGYPTIVKKLIRQLYISYKKSKKENKKLNEKLALLYERTFKEVSYQDYKSNISETNQSTVFKLNLKKLIPLIFVLISGLNISIEVFTINYFSYAFFLTSIVWTFLVTFEFNFSTSKKQTDRNEVSRKSLYDDEIAEHHLFSILKELKSNNVNVIIIFDEIDKIKTSNAVDEIISDLKPLLLSGFANNFIVAGQGLYYQLLSSYSLDDPILSSLFAKTIHIPILKYASLKNYCLDLVLDKKLIKEPILNLYFDSLILNSSRIPRKLSNQIRNNLIWENSKAYIIVDESKIEELMFTSSILNILNRVADNDLPKLNQNAVKLDFDIFQLHLWLNTIQTFKLESFTVKNVIKTVSYESITYPKIYLSQLESICEVFLQKLVDEKLLKVDNSNPHEENYFSWVILDETNSTVADTSQRIFHNNSGFMDDFLELELFVKGIYIDLIKGETWDNSKKSILQMTERLVEINVLSNKWSQNRKLQEIISLRNKFVHGDELTPDEIGVLENSNIDILRLKAELIEDYSFYVTKNHLVNYETKKESKWGFDFIAKNSSTTILFEVKYLQDDRSNSRTISEIFDKFTNYNNVNNLNNFCVIFFYLPKGRNSFNNFQEKFDNILTKKHPQHSNRILIFNTSQHEGDTNSSRIETYLNQVNEVIKTTILDSKNENVVKLNKIKNLEIDKTTLDYFLHQFPTPNIIEEKVIINKSLSVEGTFSEDLLINILNYFNLKTTYEVNDILEKHRDDLIDFISNFIDEKTKTRRGFSILYLGYYLSALKGNKKEVVDYLSTILKNSNPGELASKILINMK